jgi:putative glutathione S-transferase
LSAATSTEFASPVDTATYGEYQIRRSPGDERPLYRFRDRITDADISGADGSHPYRAASGRYHLYAGWFCPWSQRVTIERALHGLQDVISVSYVDDARDGRGWAFREQHGADPVNGFHLLRQAYDATEPGFDGHISVPTLWDRETGRVLSNDFTTMGIDVATQFRSWSTGAPTYPAAQQGQIEELDRWLGPAVNQGVGIAAGSSPAAIAARGRLLDTFSALDERLSTQRHLISDTPTPTEADVRLWVSLVRYDAQTNASGIIGASLSDYPNLWAYARDLYQRPAFRETTRFASFTRPGAVQLDWNSPSGRAELTGEST